MKWKRARHGVLPHNQNPREVIMRTYVWYSWEMLGNGQGGWEFNNRFCSGTTYDLTGEETDEELVILLGGKPGEIEVDDCDPDFSIVFVRIKDGKPLGELVPEELSCQP